MDSFDFDSSVLAAVVLLVSCARLVPLLFATLRVCMREYYSFRKWLIAARREGNADP
jgi:hypothetical protein